MIWKRGQRMGEPRQCTIGESIRVSGIGLHTGKDCSIVMHPAPAGSGIAFLTPYGPIRAVAASVSGTKRGTTLASGSAEVHTVEHVLSAMAGLGIDNALVETTGPEMPAVDGSALPFAEAMLAAGITEQDAPASLIRPDRPIWVQDRDRHIVCTPCDSLVVRAFVHFEHPLIGEQALCFRGGRESFISEIAPARTFCTSREVEAIHSAGLGLGGRDDNVIVVHDDRYSVPLRFADEFVRHKILDLLGDMLLCGGRVLADVVAIRSGHTLHAAIAGELARDVEGGKRGG